MPKPTPPAGFDEATTPYEADPEAKPQPPPAQHFKVTVGPGGRVVIPAEVRRAMGIEEGQVLYTRYENNEWHVLTRAEAVRRVQEFARQFKKPGQSVVDEFLAERRAMWGEE
ncbi:AbrB/MazE/SpoVT family DNA-binding domain-containing protein [Prosthecomicrobium sp. N25]|uniref:AbrB/MazE/SpoVT family DNA-binding domain-containing protein n=1 Tax=Prosthecomicrobium sp. N25 TaxID=3129254 RepID=UPI00307797F7